MAQIIILGLLILFVIRLAVFFIQCYRWVCITKYWKNYHSNDKIQLDATEHRAFERMEWAFDLKQIYNPILWTLEDFVNPSNFEEIYVYQAITGYYRQNNKRRTKHGKSKSQQPTSRH